MDLELKVHLKSGTILDCTQAVTKIVWSGDIKSASRTLEFDVLQAVADKEIESIGVSEGDTVSFFVSGKEIFRGILIDVDADSSNNEKKYTSKDIGYLLKNKVAFNFKNVATEKVAADVIKKLGYNAGTLTKTGQKFTKVITKSTGYDVIMAAYTEASEKTKKKYMITTTIDKFNVIEKGEKVLELQFNESENLIKSKFKSSIDKLVNKVIIVDKNGNKVSEKVDKETQKLYNITITEIEQQTEGKTDIKPEDKFKKADKSASLSGFGDITCVSGYGVHVKDTHTGLIGKFFIDSDKHTWSGGSYIVDLDLNFENIMNEVTISEGSTEKEGAIEGGATSVGGSSKAVDIAKTKLGKPYKWGATGPNTFDCSGLVYWTAKQLGKNVPRTSRQQSTYGQAVSKSQLQPGDCVFFGSPVHHVGIYVGNGKYLHAPQTGDVVKISNLNSRGDFHNARRFL